MALLFLAGFCLVKELLPDRELGLRKQQSDLLCFKRWKGTVRANLGPPPSSAQHLPDSEASSQTVAKDAGMISLRIKRIDRVSSRAANPVQEVPETILGKRKVGELRVG